MKRLSQVVGAWLGLALLSACGGSDECLEPQCPVDAFDVRSTSGNDVAGAQLVLSGPMSITINCEAGRCFIPDELTKPGDYMLTATAAGYQTQTVNVSVTYTAPGTACSCPGAHLSPDSVTFEPAIAE